MGGVTALIPGPCQRWPRRLWVKEPVEAGPAMPTRESCLLEPPPPRKQGTPPPTLAHPRVLLPVCWLCPPDPAVKSAGTGPASPLRTAFPEISQDPSPPY